MRLSAWQVRQARRGALCGHGAGAVQSSNYRASYYGGAGPNLPGGVMATKRNVQTNDKLANTVLYLLEQCGSTPPPSSTALLKMLWYADYWHYKKHLHVITGANYVALERGPVLDGYKDQFRQLEAQGALEEKKAPVYGAKDKVEYIPLKQADESVFSESELETLAEVVAKCDGKTGRSLSAATHREGPWLLVYPGNPNGSIPRPLFRWLDNQPTDADLARAAQSLKRPDVRKALGELAQES